MRIRRGQGRGKINACWKDAEEVSNLVCLFSASSLSFAAMTSFSVIKGTLHGNKCLSITGVLIVSGAWPVPQPHFPMFKRKISIGEVRLGGTWPPNMQGTLWKSHSFQCNVDLPAALFLLSHLQLLASLSPVGNPDAFLVFFHVFFFFFIYLHSYFARGAFVIFKQKKNNTTLVIDVWHQCITANRSSAPSSRTALGKDDRPCWA